MAGMGTNKNVIILWVTLALIAVFPLTLVDIPPLADYPNHLARVFILSHLDDIPKLGDYYRDVMSAQPNLAFDLIVGALARIVPLEVAGRVFSALTILSMAGGVFLLHRAIHGRFSPWSLLAFFFVYNRLYLWGFLAYLFTLGCAIAAFAAWIILRKRPIMRLFAATAMATILYLGHLYAFGVYALCIAGYELVVLWDDRMEFSSALIRSIAGGIQFVPAIYLFLFISPTSAAATMTQWSSVWRKAEGIVNVVYNYNLTFDLVCLGIIGALALGGILTRHVSIKTLMLVPLALLTIAFLAMPDRLFSSYGADKRLPIAMALIAVAACDWYRQQQNSHQQRWQRVIVGCLMALFVGRIALVTHVWLKSDVVYDEVMETLNRLPNGAKLLVVVVHPEERSLPDTPMFEIANMAIIERNAFVPSLFTYPDDAGQAVAFTDDMEKLAHKTPHHIVLPHTLKQLADDPEFAAHNSPFRPDLLVQYDFALVVNAEALPGSVALPKGRRLASGNNFVLIQIDHSS
jgi:hypothetical protein